MMWRITKRFHTNPHLKTDAITLTNNSLRVRQRAISPLPDAGLNQMRFLLNLLRRTRIVWLAFFLGGGFAEVALAHDPGLSSIMVTVKGNQLETIATFARKDVDSLMMTMAATHGGE